MSSWSDVRAIGRGDSDDDMAGGPPYVGCTLRNSWPRLRAGLFLGLPLALRPLAVCDYRFAGGVDVIAETYAIAVLVLAAPVPVVTKFAPLDLPLLVLTVAMETANAPRGFQIGRIRVIKIGRHEFQVSGFGQLEVDAGERRYHSDRRHHHPKDHPRTTSPQGGHSRFAPAGIFRPFTASTTGNC